MAGTFLTAALVLFGVFNDAVNGDYCPIATGECPNPGVSFWLRNRYIEDIFEITYSSMESAPLVENATLVVLIHGYAGHRFFSPNMELVPAYRQHGDYNLLSVDWGKLAPYPCYIQSAYNVETAGKCTAHFLNDFYRKRGMHWKEKTHVVGFSLGAHVAGVMGYFLPNMPRISGLDPALPLFQKELLPPRFRLDSSDAVFVDAYHTDAGFKGRLSPVGHVDFYINDGEHQPGCNTNSSCDHLRAVEVFAESINTNTGFYGVSCAVNIVFFIVGLSRDVCIPVPKFLANEALGGEYASSRSRGTYMIKTNDRPPYAQGKLFV